MLSNEEIVDLYRRQAKHYDFVTQLYYLAGFRVWAYRKAAINALALRRGDTVVEFGCGTGLNFGLLEKEIGTEGRIIGVDLTDAMLSRARERVRRKDWSNVELVHSDWSTFRFPPRVHGIISTFALTTVPENENVIRAGSEALVPGGRFVILGFKLPNNWLLSLVPLFLRVIRPWRGQRLAELIHHYGSHQPWEPLKKYLANISVTELYAGLAYIAVGERDK